MSSSHVQVSPDGSGKDIDTDALVSTETGNPTVYRQDIVVADPNNYGNKASVSSGGEQYIRAEDLMVLLKGIQRELKRIRWVLQSMADHSSDDEDIDTEEEL